MPVRIVRGRLSAVAFNEKDLLCREASMPDRGSEEATQRERFTEMLRGVDASLYPYLGKLPRLSLAEKGR